MFGKTSLVEKIIQDTHTSYKELQWTEDANLISDLDLGENQLEIFKDFYSDTKADLKYIKINRNYDSTVLSKKNIYLHLLLIERDIGNPVYKVEESEKIDEYYHGWRRTYIWLLVDWILIDEMFLGIS